jgi:hypothetical protein
VQSASVPACSSASLWPDPVLWPETALAPGPPPYALAAELDPEPEPEPPRPTQNAAYPLPLEQLAVG